MASFNTRIYGTEELHSNQGVTPLNRVETWLDHALNDDSSHSADITVADSYKIPAPTEESQTRFYAEDPCAAGGEVAWDYLSNWWYYYAECNYATSDCDLLITNSTGYVGRCAENTAAVVEGGPMLADAHTDTSDLFFHSDGGTWDAMQTALHEAGHAFMYGGQDGFEEHNVGMTYYNSGDYHRSPFCKMNKNKSPDENECGHNTYDVTDSKNWYMAYSECAKDKFRK